MQRLEITVYAIGSVFFSLIALVISFACIFTNDLKRSKAIVLQLDDAFNVALNGEKDMKFSSRCYVGASLGVKKYQVLMYLIDKAFEIFAGEKRHCYYSYLNDLNK